MNTARLVAMVMSVILFWSMGCAKDLVTGKQTMNWYSIESDIKLGSDVMNRQVAELNQKGKREGKAMVDAPGDRQQLELAREILARIKPVTHYPDFPYDVHIADVDVANAWCAPGGKIMIFSGLWDPKEGLIDKGNADQLAAVMSHEIAHATARHVTEMISRSMAIQLIGTAAAAGIHAGAGAQAAGAFNQAAGFGLNIYFPMYSRDNETEADKIGLVYMAKAGYDPRIAVELWERAAKTKKKPYSIFATHPASGARAKTLSDMLPEVMPYYLEAKKKYEKPAKRKKTTHQT